jgi:hypothetical protein
MKAGVPRSTSCNLQLARSWRTVDDLRNLAYNMLLSPPRDQWYQRDPWADQETTDNIRSTAKQAFLETVMFKIDLTTSFATLRHHSASSASPPLLRATGAHTAAAHMQQLTFGARIHHLHLSITVFGNHHYGCVSVIACQGAIECMDSLKLHFPNLKACILTFNIHTTPSIVAFNQHTLLWKATFFDPGNTANALGTEISRLFDAFATNGPGKPKFVQIRKITGTGSSHPCHYGPLVEVDSGQMDTKRQDGSLGGRLLEDAYRLARTGLSPPSLQPVSTGRWRR